MQRPQRERRVAHPAVAVVPVALAARRLRQRGRQRGDHRAGRRVGQPLQHERRALQVRRARGGRGRCRRRASCARSGRSARASARPARRCADRRGSPSTRARRSASRPRPSCGAPCVRLPSMPMRRSLNSRTSSRRRWRRSRRVVRVGVDRSTVLHSAGVRAVVEHRLADQLDLDLTLDALDRAHEQVVGVVVGRRARVARAVLVSCQSPIVSASRTRSQPGGVIQVVSMMFVPGLVAAPGGHVDAVRAEAEAAGAAIEQRAEDGRRVEARQAQPLDRAVGGDERAGVAVGQERVVGDRRERRAFTEAARGGRARRLRPDRCVRLPLARAVARAPRAPGRSGSARGHLRER